MPKNVRGTMATLGEKKAELAAIDAVAFPRLYQAIGRRVARLANVPPSLASHVERIRELESSEPKSSASGGVGNTGVPATSDALGSAYASIGREAVTQYGAKAVPKEIAPEFESLTKAREALVAELEALQARTRDRLVTPRRLVAAGVLLVAALGGLAFVRNASALFGARKDGAAVSGATGSVSGLSDLANDSVGPTSPRSLADKEVAEIRGIAERTAKTFSEKVNGLVRKESASAIQDGCDAAFREWRSSAAKLLSPITDTASAKALPAWLKTGLFREALAEFEDDYRREVAEITDELTRLVDSTKEEAGGSFTFLLDNGKPFVVPPDQRIPALEQCCARLANYVADATTKLANKRAAGVQSIAAAWEQTQSDLASITKTLENDIQAGKQRFVRESKALVDAVEANSSGRDGSTAEAVESRMAAFKKEMAAIIDSEVTTLDEYCAKRAGEFPSLVKRGGDTDALREKQRELTSDLAARVEESLKVIHGRCNGEKRKLAERAERSRVAVAETGTSRDDAQAADGNRESPQTNKRIETTPPPDPSAGEFDPAVLAVLGEATSDYSEHGFADMELGQTFEEVNQKVPLARYDPRYPWRFLSREEDQYFMFDDGGTLRIYGREYNGGPDINGERILQLFGKASNQPIERRYGSSKSQTRSTMLVYLLPKARAIALVEFREVKFVRFSDVETIEKTVVLVMDLPWALPLLYRSAQLKRPVMEWMQAAAERVAAGSCNVDDLLSPPGTGMMVEGRGEKQVAAYLIDGGEGGRGKPKKQRRLGWVKCVSEDLLPYAHARPGTVGVEVNFGNYTCLESNVLLKQHPKDDGSQPPPVEAIKTAPLLSLLDYEVTRQLLMEYFEPNGGKYTSAPDEHGGVSLGSSRYEWKCVGIRDAVFEVICNTNGASAVFFLTRRGL